MEHAHSSELRIYTKNVNPNDHYIPLLKDRVKKIKRVGRLIIKNLFRKKKVSLKKAEQICEKN